jgi:hypothetical protein
MEKIEILTRERPLFFGMLSAVVTELCDDRFQLGNTSSHIHAGATRGRRLSDLLKDLAMRGIEGIAATTGFTCNCGRCNSYGPPGISCVPGFATH